MVKEFIRGIIESLQKHEKCFLQVNLFTFQKQANMFFVSQFDLPQCFPMTILSQITCLLSNAITMLLLKNVNSKIVIVI